MLSFPTTLNDREYLDRGHDVAIPASERLLRDGSCLWLCDVHVKAPHPEQAESPIGTMVSRHCVPPHVDIVLLKRFLDDPSLHTLEAWDEGRIR
jgi:hypothetical protein